MMLNEIQLRIERLHILPTLCAGWAVLRKFDMSAYLLGELDAMIRRLTKERHEAQDEVKRHNSYGMSKPCAPPTAPREPTDDTLSVFAQRHLPLARHYNPPRGRQ
jgi:hypothetical protein